MSRLFFSYSRADAEFVLRLAGDLRAGGVDLWVDQEDIPAGERWDRAVEEAMKSASSMLVVLSPVSAGSQNVLDEISYGLETGKRIIPVLHKACDIPFRLRRLQYVDFTGNYEKALGQLKKAIGVRDDPAPVSTGSAAAVVTPEPAGRTAGIDVPAPGTIPDTTQTAEPAPAAPQEPRRQEADRPPPIRTAPSPIESNETRSRFRYGYALAAALLVIIAVVGYVMLKDREPAATDAQVSAREAVTPPAPQPSGAAPPSAPAVTPLNPGPGKRYTVRPCGSIHDAQTNLEWFVGPDRNMTWQEAERWTGALPACGGGWQMPTIRQLQTLYDKQSTAGTGYSTGGRHFPARMDPVFAAIGGGSWVWAREASGASGVTFNFYRGAAADVPRTETTFAIRAFAVRRARSAATTE